MIIIYAADCTAVLDENMEKVFNIYIFFHSGVDSLKRCSTIVGVRMGDGAVDLVNQHIRLFMDRMFLFETRGGILSGWGRGQILRSAPIYAGGR